MENWTVVITAALGIVDTLTAPLLGQWVTLKKDRRLRQDELDRNARYLAIRVVCKLDPFVNECCNVVGDWGEEDQEGYSHARTSTPTISFPDDLDWKSIGPDLMYRILGLPNELDTAEQSIDSAYHHGSTPPDYSEFFEERAFQYGQLGRAALALADDIRRIYRIPTREFVNWHPKDTLESAVTEIQKRRKEVAAAHAKFVLQAETTAKA